MSWFKRRLHPDDRVLIQNVWTGLASVQSRLMKLENAVMALKATDQALITEIHRNTDVAKAATAALTTLQGNVADLTTKLADAIANSDASDDADVKAALNELKANNDAQAAATPAIAAAVANTDPSAQPPTAPAG